MSRDRMSHLRKSSEAQDGLTQGTTPLQFYDNFLAKVQHSPTWSPKSEQVSLLLGPSHR